MSWFKENKFLGGLLVVTVLLAAIIISFGMKAGTSLEEVQQLVGGGRVLDDGVLDEDHLLRVELDVELRRRRAAARAHRRGVEPPCGRSPPPPSPPSY